MFIIDFNMYKIEKIFELKWYFFQGFVFLVYNNSYFIDDDIVGIQYLG